MHCKMKNVSSKHVASYRHSSINKFLTSARTRSFRAQGDHAKLHPTTSPPPPRDVWALCFSKNPLTPKN